MSDPSQITDMSIREIRPGETVEPTSRPNAGIVDVTGMTATEVQEFVAEHPEQDVAIQHRGGRTFVVVE